METRVLQRAGHELARFVGDAARILSTDWWAPSRSTFVFEDVETGSRHKLILDFALAHPSAHLDGVSKNESHHGGFAQRLRGSFLTAVSVASDDRWWELSFRKPTGDDEIEEYRLVAAWIGSRYNAWLLDRDGYILEQARPRGPRIGDAYVPPEPDLRPRGRDLDPALLVERLSDTLPERWTRELTRLARDWTPAQALDVLIRAARAVVDERSVESKEPPSLDKSSRLPFGRQAVEQVVSRILTLAAERDVPAGQAVEAALYEIPGQTEIPLAIEGIDRVVASGLGLLPAFVASPPLPSLQAFETRRIDGHESIYPLLSKAYRVCRSKIDENERRDFFVRRCGDEMKRLLRLRQRLSDELGDENYGTRLRQRGETILAHLHEIERGADKLVAPNLYEEGAEPFEIELDPRKPATDTAEKLFHLARRWGKSRPIRQKRIAQLDEAITALSMAQVKIMDAKSLADDRAAEQWIKKSEGSFYKMSAGLRSRLARSGDESRSQSGQNSGGASNRSRQSGTVSGRGGGRSGSSATNEKRRPEERFHPRRYQTEAGWTVVVGRSNEENDYVTHRLGKQDDYWFHAHGVPGSHVLLKRDGRKDNPSQKTIREAAAIAAFFSKARHSSRVPVIYTLKKHVRKPRKAKAGLALCSQEQMVMVAPRNPEDAGPSPEN